MMTYIHCYINIINSFNNFSKSTETITMNSIYIQMDMDGMVNIA